MVRVLLLGDTHIGFDLPQNPRAKRRARGPDFVANLRRALRPALDGEVDLVLHSGDVFDRPNPPLPVARLAYDPLLEVAATGLPVLVIPGNHERSRFPFPLLLAAPTLHTFEDARWWRGSVAGARMEILAMPFRRSCDGRALRETLGDVGPPDPSADIRLMLAHLAVEGAVVGIQDFAFRAGRRDVLAGGHLPRGFAAVLSGHIHRRQILDHGGIRTVYAGAIERTSIVEREEPKGYAILELEPGPDGGTLQSVEFVDLPTRPMTLLEPRALEEAAVLRFVGAELAGLPPDSIVQVKLRPGATLRAAALRAIAPETMSLRVTVPRRRLVS